MAHIVHLGVDYYGYQHLYDPERDRIIVIDSRGIDFQADLDNFPGETTQDWMEYVQEQRGPWRETVEGRVVNAIADTLP